MALDASAGRAALEGGCRRGVGVDARGVCALACVSHTRLAQGWAPFRTLCAFREPTPCGPLKVLGITPASRRKTHTTTQPLAPRPPLAPRLMRELRGYRRREGGRPRPLAARRDDGCGGRRRARVAAVRAIVPLLAALLATGCGGASHPTARHARAAAAGAACTDRLPLDTLLRVPGGPRRPRPLILALHGARQSGYGLQSYTGFTDDAPGFLVAYPNTPHHNGFWAVDDVPALLALIDAVGRCVPVSGVDRGGVLQRRPDGQRAGLPRRAARARDRAGRLGLRGPRALRAGRAGVGARHPRHERPGRGLSRPARLHRHVGAARPLRAAADRAPRGRGDHAPALARLRRRHAAWSTCASPGTPTAGRRSRTPTSAWSASCAPWADRAGP